MSDTPSEPDEPTATEPEDDAPGELIADDVDG
jgi:hypothetical protein